tara:strand:+ start:58 stop:585 length:528 start_codon:yes stop_codon:yes gene_type:complete
MAITIHPDGKFSTGSLITEVDHWYLNQNATSNGAIPGTYWTRNLKVGTGMTLSQDVNGRWTFPSTGIWKITTHPFFRPVASDNCYFDIYITRNSFSDVYHYARGGKSSGNASNSNLSQNGANSHLIDIENISTYGIVFYLGSHGGGSYTQGSGAGAWNSGTPMYTTVMFERIGDT